MFALIKVLVFLLCMAPFGNLVYQGFWGSLGSNPVETIMHSTGEWALRFLLLTLAISPLREYFNLRVLIRYRRMLGLFTFFYATLHISNYLWLDQYFDWMEIQKDILKRPYITIGFTAYVLLLPLALTSTNYMIRVLGQRWKKLHQLVYVAAVCVMYHFLWLVKADEREPLIYMSVLLVLLLVRTDWLQRVFKPAGTHRAPQIK